MSQYDVRTSSLTDRTRVAVLLEWQTLRMVSAIRQPQSGIPELFLRSLVGAGDAERTAEFVRAVGKNVRVNPACNAQFLSTMDGILKYVVAYSNGSRRIHFNSSEDLHSYLRSNNEGLDSDSLSIEVIHEK